MPELDYDRLERVAYDYVRRNPECSTADLRDGLGLDDGHYAVLQRLRWQGDVTRDRRNGKGPYRYVVVNEEGA